MRSFKISNIVALMLIVAVSMITKVDSLECYSCWSNNTNTPECAVGAVANSARIECPDTDLCLTAIVDGVTFRGCASSLSLPADYPLKETCDNENCNFRIYPTDRMICYKCQGNECNQPKGNSRACLVYSATDQCYTDVINTTDTVRGCVSDGNYTATEYTATCGSKLCNNQPSFEPLECLTCISNDTLECIRPANAAQTCQLSISSTCTVDVLLGRQGSCYTYQSGDYIERGCSKEDTSASRNTTYSVEYETKCYTNQCNNECIPQSVCYTCESVFDPSCANDLSSFTPQTCSSQAISSCFTCLGTDGSTFRGCGAGESVNNSVECRICVNEAACNQFVFEVATTTTTEATTTTSTTTSTASSTTTSTATPASTTTTIEVPTNATTGVTTPTTATPPVEPIECYQCNGTAECLTLTNASTPLPCPDANDRCVQIMSSSKMYRGCLSQPAGELCLKDYGLCRMCSTPGCNGLPLVQESNLTCMQCFSLDCEWGMGPDASAACAKVYYFQTESCYIYHNPQGSVERGCASNLRCITNGWKCDYCDSDDCNGENLVWQFCLQCDSSNNLNCISAKGIESSRCPSKVQTYEDRGCYVYREEDGHVIRGCLSDLNSTSLDGTYYTKCLNQSCNTMSFNGAPPISQGCFVASLLSTVLILLQIL